MKDICKIEGCETLRQCRGLCAFHYGKFRREGSLDTIADPHIEGYHRLTDVDREAKTATCGVCGPVAVRIRPGRKGVECMVKRRESRGLFGPVGRPRRKEPHTWVYWKYGLEAAEHRALLNRAGGKCELCGTDIEGAERVDHCHETGLVRGILCHRCNVGLGWFDDSPPRLLAAYLYLKASGKSDADWINRSA